MKQQFTKLSNPVNAVELLSTFMKKNRQSRRSRENLFSTQRSLQLRILVRAQLKLRLRLQLRFLNSSSPSPVNQLSSHSMLELSIVMF